MVRKLIYAIKYLAIMRLAVPVALLLLFLILPATSAAVVKNKISILTVHDSIAQGEANWYCKYVASPAFTVSLVWNNPSNSLTLTVFSPDGSWTTFTDQSDGSKDGKIVVTIYDATSGYWFFEVYGAKVVGSQQYCFSVT